MKTKIIIIATVLSLKLTDASAQGLYAGLNGGYGFNLASQNLAVNNANGNGTSNSYELVKGSFGKGVNFGANVGYMFNKNIGAELGISYLLGSKFESTFSKGVNYYTRNQFLSGKMLRLMPSIRITSGEGKLKPYLRLGIVIGLGGKITSTETEVFTGASPTSETTWEYKGGVSFGFAGAVGLNYQISNKIAVFGECGFISQSWAPTKGVLTKDNQNGVDVLPTLTTSQKQTDFVSKYSESFVTPANTSEPSKQLKAYSPFSSLGFNIGIQFNFGKKE
ncbi:MAG: outer membrane beta-barrel protein [Bacteroidia bacterium]